MGLEQSVMVPQDVAPVQEQAFKHVKREVSEEELQVERAAIQAKLVRAAVNKQKINDEKAAKLRQHHEKVAQLCADKKRQDAKLVSELEKEAKRDTIRAKLERAAVNRETLLGARKEKLQQREPEAKREAIQAKLERAAGNRNTLLEDRKAKLQQHHEKVAQLCLDKKKRRGDEKVSELEKEVKRQAIRAKLGRAAVNRESLLGARKEKLQQHHEKVEQLCADKKKRLGDEKQSDLHELVVKACDSVLVAKERALTAGYVNDVKKLKAKYDQDVALLTNQVVQQGKQIEELARKLEDFEVAE